MKTCGKCKKSKPVAEFNKAKKGLYGRQRYCRACQSLSYRENRAKRLEQTKQSKRRNTGARYGLTEQETIEFRARNNGLCECCHIKVATCIDHDHVTGKLRGHLCGTCNTGIGMLGDSLQGALNAVAYLEK